MWPRSLDRHDMAVTVGWCAATAPSRCVRFGPATTRTIAGQIPYLLGLSREPQGWYGSSRPVPATWGHR